MKKRLIFALKSSMCSTQKISLPSSKELCTLCALTSVVVPHTVLDGQPVSLPGFSDAQPVSTDYLWGQLSMDFTCLVFLGLDGFFTLLPGRTNKRTQIGVVWLMFAFFQNFVQSVIAGTSSQCSGKESLNLIVTQEKNSRQGAGVFLNLAAVYKDFVIDLLIHSLKYKIILKKSNKVSSKSYYVLF